MRILTLEISANMLIHICILTAVVPRTGKIMLKFFLKVGEIYKMVYYILNLD